MGSFCGLVEIAPGPARNPDPWNLSAEGGTPQNCEARPKNIKGMNGLGSICRQRGQYYSPRIPGGFTLHHRSDETLGRGPRSEPRAPLQMVSGALGSLGFRV